MNRRNNPLSSGTSCSRHPSGAYARVLLAGLLGLSMLTAPASAAPMWTTVWADEFDGPAGSLPAAANWILDLGHSYPGGAANWGNNELESYTKDPKNISLDGAGDLRITATKDSSGKWFSGRIETQRTDFQPPAGGKLRIEARLDLPVGGPGYWPAFWTLGAPFRGNYTNWPQAGEIDIMENINSEKIVHGTLHCGKTENGGPCKEDTGLTAQYTLPSAGFHIYAMEWSATQLQWLVDDKPYSTIKKSTVGTSTWNSTFGHGYFVLLNLAMGGDWPGKPTSTTVPGKSMVVDYVRVMTG
jgi:beta-glucanase (GH16 family)